MTSNSGKALMALVNLGREARKKTIESGVQDLSFELMAHFQSTWDCLKQSFSEMGYEPSKVDDATHSYADREIRHSASYHRFFCSLELNIDFAPGWVAQSGTLSLRIENIDLKDFGQAVSLPFEGEGW